MSVQRFMVIHPIVVVSMADLIVYYISYLWSVFAGLYFGVDVMNVARALVRLFLEQQDLNPAGHLCFGPEEQRCHVADLSAKDS